MDYSLYVLIEEFEKGRTEEVSGRNKWIVRKYTKSKYEFICIEIAESPLLIYNL